MSSASISRRYSPKNSNIPRCCSKGLDIPTARFAISRRRLPLPPGFLLSVDLPTPGAPSSNPQMPPPTSPSPLTSRTTTSLSLRYPPILYPLRLRPPSTMPRASFRAGYEEKCEKLDFLRAKTFQTARPPTPAYSQKGRKFFQA